MTIAAAPALNAITMPGTKWWMCRRPTLRLRNGPTRGRERSSVVISAAITNVVTNEVSRLNIAFSRVETSW